MNGTNCQMIVLMLVVSICLKIDRYLIRAGYT